MKLVTKNGKKVRIFSTIENGHYLIEIYNGYRE